MGRTESQPKTQQKLGRDEMKTYKTQQDVEQDIHDGVLAINEDVRFECDVSICASIISAWDINARNISAWNISARDINAGDINAGDISYYAFCCVYKSIHCTGITGRYLPHRAPVCLAGEVKIITQ